jgi:hypothetical protein
MTKKEQREMASALRLLHALGLTSVTAKPSDRPDIILSLDQSDVGLEVTDLHPDDADLKAHGSPLRITEEQRMRNARGKPYAMWLHTASLPAFRSRISDKVTRARSYDRSHYSELWLLTASQLPHAVASTYVFAPFVRIDDLNQYSDDLLASSPYSRAYLHLQLDDAVWEWTRESKWTHRARTAPSPQPPTELWFKSLLRDPEWLSNPDSRAVKEAQRALAELRRARSRK